MIKNILQRSKLFTILLFCFLLCACSIEGINEKINNIDAQIGEELEKIESNKETKNDENKQNDVIVTDNIKDQIEQWIKDNDLNRYGDMIGTVYAGGTPLFDEVTGKALDRYEYIIEKHPELKDLFKISK